MQKEDSPLKTTTGMIPVTKTFLPPFQQYEALLKTAWKKRWVTNHGPLSIRLERDLKKILSCKYAYLVTNGTIGLQVAIRSAGLTGSVITTPFSYVATTSSLVWEGCSPVFVDIDPLTLTIDPKKIEQAITKDTSGILATHVYGNPCDVESISLIAKKYKLKVIYDAAHAFGVRYKNKPLVNYGDLSVLSFHATKLFHTVEGGAVIAKKKEEAQRAMYLRNFGHKGTEEFFGLGINGKMSELHAAMGICILPKVKNLIEKRRKASWLYDSLLSESLSKPVIREKTEYNYAYYPVIFPTEKNLKRTLKKLNEAQIFPRRYFYPSLTGLDYVNKQEMPVAEDIARRILCLPLFHDLRASEIEKVAQIINANLC